MTRQDMIDYIEGAVGLYGETAWNKWETCQIKLLFHYVQTQEAHRKKRIG